MPEKYLVRYLHHDEPEAKAELNRIWLKLVREKLLDALFYDGSARTWEDFQAEILRPGCLPFAVYGYGELAMFTWLNHIRGGAARSHFAVFRNFQGRKKRIALGKHVYRHILRLRDNDGFILDSLYGITPQSHALALKAVLACGWLECGRMPRACYLARNNEWVDGIMTFATREILEAAQ